MVKSLVKSFTKNICCWNTATTPTITALKNQPSDKSCTFWRMELLFFQIIESAHTHASEEYDYIMFEQKDPGNNIYGFS